MDCSSYREQKGVKHFLRASRCSNCLFITVTIWRFTWRRMTTRSHSSAQYATGVTTQRRPLLRTCRTTRKTNSSSSSSSNNSRMDTTTATAAALAAITRRVLLLPALPSAVCSAAKRSGNPKNCRWDRAFADPREDDLQA